MKWYKTLTKEDLMNFGIVHITKDGHAFNKKGKEIKQCKSSKNKNGRWYWNFVFSNKKEKVKSKQKRLNAAGEIVYYDSYTYKTIVIGVHRAIYVWYNGIQPAGMDVDHIDNDPLNNNLENLQLITPGENLAKERPESDNYLNYTRFPKKKQYTEEYILSKIKHYEDKQSEIRSKYHGLEREFYDHKLRSNITQWKNKLKKFYFLKNLEK